MRPFFVIPARLPYVIPATERQVFAENAYREGRQESTPSVIPASLFVIPAQAGIQTNNFKI
jgi:hypothetical protein